ncbi:hypothetical protein [Mucilaginibacter sp.]|uniref:hypothetical protein n=1 Tax=Mucilaginibacter sp. TaxID=1882438 RepID=UPI0025F7AA14|nr:hypothetical protein [Mucilaginibacter sp.]
METIEQKIKTLESKIAEIEARGKKPNEDPAGKPDIAAAIRKYTAEQNAKNLKK